MTFEILEKVGEISITQMRTAEENKAIATAEAARLAELDRLTKLQKEQELEKKAAQFVQLFMKEINQNAEKGQCLLQFWWSEEEPCSNGITYREWEDLVEKFTSVFEKWGYEVDTHWYSSSWRKRTGRIGYAYIRW